MDLGEILAQLKQSPDTFGPFIRQQAERIPDRIALKFEDEQVTYGAYNAEVNRLAAVLHRDGVRPNTPVAICAHNSPLFLIAFGACAKLGAIAALINTHVTGAGLTHVLRVAGAVSGICDAAALARLQDVVGTHPVRFFADAPAGTIYPSDVRPLRDALAPAGEPAIPDVRGGDIIAYIYTSGTTGYPKPAIVRHLRFTMGGISLPQMMGLEDGETIYAPLPLYHGESLFVGFSSAFRLGGAFASRRQFSASEFLSDVRRHEAVAFVYVGELCRYLLRQPATSHDRDHRLRVAAGAGLRPDIWTTFVERFGIARVLEMYGATEGNVALQNLDNRPGSVGKPHAMLEDTVALVRYDHGQGDVCRDAAGHCIPCDTGEPGELLGRVGHGGGMEYDGYTDRAATERKLLRNVFAAGDAWFRTGDLLRKDAEGYYYFIDRIGDTFRWKGENVATHEVGDLLCRAPGVTEANVYGVPVPGEDGRVGMAAIVLSTDAPFDGAGLYAHATTHLPRYALPAFVRLVGEMEVTGTLKQRKQSLQGEGYDPTTVGDPLFVRDDARAAFVPLTPERLAAVRSGRLRL